MVPGALAGLIWPTALLWTREAGFGPEVFLMLPAQANVWLVARSCTLVGL